MFGFGKKKRKLKNGVIDKTVSYMMAVPKKQESIENPNEIIQRLKNSELFKVEKAELNENIELRIMYEDEVYDVELIPEEYSIGGMYTVNHHLTEENYKIITESSVGLTVAMTFGNSILESYHLQLKILAEAVPEMAGVIDFCAEKILSGVWTKLAIEAEVPPCPDYIYSVQAISGENDEVWLHTHGLNRCGSIEVEILNSDKDNYKNHFYILQTLAKRVISDNKFINEEEPFWIGRMNNGEDLVATWIDYNEALKKYDKNILGGLKDREDGHNENTGIVYLYLSEEDFEKKKYTHVSAVNDYISDNLLMMYTNEETLRMSLLAIDRLDYFVEGIKKDDIEGLMKIGLEVDDEYKNEDDTFREHIWFHIKEVNGLRARGILTQEPYYIKDLKAETEMEVDLRHLTDWILYTPKGQITPDNAYLLEEN